MSTTIFPLFCNQYPVIVKQELDSVIKKNNICRLCLQKHEKLVNIFDEEDEQDTNEISRYIEIFFAVQITKTDPYSTFVCKPCWDRIITLCKYRLQFRKNDASLRSRNEVTVSETVPETSDCHYSVRNLLFKGIKLNIDYWNINFDAKVDLSNWRVSDERWKNKNDSLQASNKDQSYLRSGKNLKACPSRAYHKRRLSDYCNYYCFPNDTEGSIALNRSKRHPKRTKIFGDPFTLADENAEDSDSDPVFSILKTYKCESAAKNLNILSATNFLNYLITSINVLYLNPYPKRASTNEARQNLCRWFHITKLLSKICFLLLIPISGKETNSRSPCIDAMMRKYLE